MDKDTILGPLTTKKRLEELEELVEKLKMKVLKFFTEVKSQLVLIKVFFMSLQYSIM